MGGEQVSSQSPQASQAAPQRSLLGGLSGPSLAQYVGCKLGDLGLQLACETSVITRQMRWVSTDEYTLRWRCHNDAGESEPRDFHLKDMFELMCSKKHIDKMKQHIAKQFEDSSAVVDLGCEEARVEIEVKIRGGMKGLIKNPRQEEQVWESLQQVAESKWSEAQVKHRYQRLAEERKEDEKRRQEEDLGYLYTVLLDRAFPISCMFAPLPK